MAPGGPAGPTGPTGPGDPGAPGKPGEETMKCSTNQKKLLCEQSS